MFSRSRDLYVYLQAYQRERDDHAAARGVRELLSGRREGVRDGAGRRHRRAGRAVEGRARPVQPFRSASLPPGRYDCQVTVLDPTGAEGRVLARADRRRAVDPESCDRAGTPFEIWRTSISLPASAR